MAIEKRRVGQTSLHVTALGLGTATLGGVANVARAEAEAIAANACQAGIRYFDTAPQYGYGKSEHIVGAALCDRADIVLSTKVGRLLKPLRLPRPPGDIWHAPLAFEPIYDYSFDGVMRSFEDSLQRLGLNHIDIAFIHDPDVYVRETGNPPEAFGKAIDGAFRALDELRRHGYVKAIGIGVNETKPIADALDRGQWDCFLLAGRYTLLEQEPLHSLFPSVARHGASIIIGGPFNSGILAGRDTWNYTRAPVDVTNRVNGLARISAAHGVPLAAVALQFPLAHPAVVSAIPGPRSTEELRQIIDWYSTAIPAALWQDMKAEKLIDAEAPVPT